MTDREVEPTEARLDALPIARGFAALVGVAFVLIVLGALVRANGAGLACPDWPLCFGEFVPTFDLEVAFEWSHRVLAGTLSLGFVGLSWAALRKPDARRAVGRLLGVTAVVLAVQILLGALTVWKLLASWSVTSHLITGNTFAVCLLLTSRELAERSRPGRARPHIPHVARWAITACMGLLVLQMTLGGLVASKYAGLACPDWPTCMNGEWFPTLLGAQGIHVLHRLVAYTLVAGLVAASLVAKRIPLLAGLVFAALGIALCQVGVGVANVLLRVPVEVTGLHSALAAALVLTLSFATREAWRAPS